MVKGKGARKKGHDWERRVAMDLREIDPSARRVLEYQKGVGYDIQLDTLPFLVQCKSQMRPNLISALGEAVEAQACDPMLAGRVPLAVCKVTNKGEFVTLRWSDFLSLIKRVHWDY